METNINKLHRKASFERLTQEEITYVLDCLKNPDKEELDYLLYILGKEGMHEYKPEYQGIVEPYLDYPEDSMVSETALKVLCQMWGQTEKYLPQVEAFIDGVEWDEDEWIRFRAIGIVGKYLNKHDKEPVYSRLLKKLFDIFNTSEDPMQREAAYLAMANAIGRDVQYMVEITYNIKHPDFYDKIDESKVDRSVLEEVSTRLEGRYVPKNDPDLAVDLYELCRKASLEGLTEEEIALVLRRLNNDPKESLYQLLYCLAHVGKRAYKPEYQKIMESYLHYPFDPSMSGYALGVLCRTWHQTEQYLPQIEAFIDGVEWNEYHHGTRLTAIEIAGEYLNGREGKPFYKRLLKKIFDVFNTTDSSIRKEYAYFAMANAIGRGLEEGTNILYDEDHPDDLYSTFDVDERKLDRTIIEEVKARLEAA